MSILIAFSAPTKETKLIYLKYFSSSVFFSLSLETLLVIRMECTKFDLPTKYERQTQVWVRDGKVFRWLEITGIVVWQSVHLSWKSSNHQSLCSMKCLTCIFLMRWVWWLMACDDVNKLNQNREEADRLKTTLNFTCVQRINGTRNHLCNVKSCLFQGCAPINCSNGK